MHYRLYALHEASGRIVGASDILAEDDAQAIAAGRAAFDRRPFEIWCQTRRVFAPDGPAAVAAT